MGTEIERKWLSSPAALDVVRTAAPDAFDHGAELRQGYLAVDGTVSARIRLTSERAVLTVKGGTGLTRTEVEFDVDPESAEQLWELTAGRRITKRRHRLPQADTALVAEVDEYHGDLDGLVTVEVEFPDVTSANSFVAPEWFGLDVTADGRWTNAALALHGRPDAILPT